MDFLHRTCGSAEFPPQSLFGCEKTESLQAIVWLSSLDLDWFSLLDLDRFSSLDQDWFSSMDLDQFSSLDQERFSSLDQDWFFSLDLDWVQAVPGRPLGVKIHHQACLVTKPQLVFRIRLGCWFESGWRFCLGALRSGVTKGKTFSCHHGNLCVFGAALWETGHAIKGPRAVWNPQPWQVQCHNSHIKLWTIHPGPAQFSVLTPYS